MPIFMEWIAMFIVLSACVVYLGAIFFVSRIVFLEFWDWVWWKVIPKFRRMFFQYVHSTWRSGKDL